ncbi:MAG: hypothetical protein V4631_12500 [Pseudomonadota bacterium]
MTQTQKPDPANKQNPVAVNSDETLDPTSQQQNLDGSVEAESDPEGSVGTGMNPP